MSDDERGPVVRDAGVKHQGEQRTSPYPMSRLAPVHDLVDIARQIAAADTMLGAVASAELSQIAEQIRGLQARARAVLAEANESLEIHRARCSFQKRPGHVYHLYEREGGERWLSMIGPEEWSEPSAERRFLGSFRLELDQSFARVDQGGARERAVVTASQLVATAPQLLGGTGPTSS
ncbi:MAG: DUF2452 domain-containing protein [Sandaracinaceae bacterium]|nr:DUF2452 domain-containing protein [Sandaracinaceae bacterium]